MLYPLALFGLVIGPLTAAQEASTLLRVFTAPHLMFHQGRQRATDLTKTAARLR